MCDDGQKKTENCLGELECRELLPQELLDLIRKRLKIDLYRKIEEREVRGVTNL